MEEEVDRLTALPDALKHEILSHLDTRDVVQTSLLSNSWRYIWLSTPYTAFDFDYWVNKCRLHRRKRGSFMNFVFNVLNDTSSKILNFSLITYNHDFDFDLPLVSSWVNKCLERNVQHLILRFPIHDRDRGTSGLDTLLPQNLFNSSVRVLRIWFGPASLVPLPIMTPASNIKNLFLHGVRLPGGNAEGELKLNFTNLEELVVESCDLNHLKVLSVLAPLLDTLRLELFSRMVSMVKVKVKIFAHKLISLSLSTRSNGSDVPVEYIIEGDLISLVSACIHICVDAIVEEEHSQSLINILHKVYNAQTLQLSNYTKQVLTDFPLLLKRVPHHFQNLRHIMLVDRMKVPCFQEIINFLLSFPRMESLVLKRTWRRWDVVSSKDESIATMAEKLGSNIPFQNVFSCLRRVKLLNLKGTKIELQFLSFLLERAIPLNELIIEYDGLSSEDLKDFKEKILYLPQTSSHVSISFRMKS